MQNQLDLHAHHKFNGEVGISSNLTEVRKQLQQPLDGTTPTDNDAVPESAAMDINKQCQMSLNNHDAELREKHQQNMECDATEQSTTQHQQLEDAKRSTQQHDTEGNPIMNLGSSKEPYHKTVTDDGQQQVGDCTLQTVEQADTNNEMEASDSMTKEPQITTTKDNDATSDNIRECNQDKENRKKSKWANDRDNDKNSGAVNSG